MKRLLTVAKMYRPKPIVGSILVALAIVTIGFAVWMKPAVAGAEDKCTICHVPPGNPPNAHTLVVGCSAVDAHLRNHPGDCLGPCPCQPTPSQNQ